MPEREIKHLYAAFDVFPGYKGAQAHIARNIETISSFSGSVTLACLGFGDMPAWQQEGNITIRRFHGLHPNFLKRTELFGNFLYSLADRSCRTSPETVHFRDIWSGLPLLSHPATKKALKIFEVNSFPSIELPVHYPLLKKNPVLISKLRRMEDFCLRTSDAIITVSRVTAKYIESRGIEAGRISVIPNMADEVSPELAAPEIPAVRQLTEPGREYILYSGVLSAWQGVPHLIKAFGYLPGKEKLCLVIAASNNKHMRPIRKLIEKEDIVGRSHLISGLSSVEMAGLYRNALLTAAPLARSERNELQGCCPVKIVESMAAGTPVVASDLEVCRELIDHRHNGWLVKPESPRALAAAIRHLLDNRDTLCGLGLQAKVKAKTCFNRELFSKRLRHIYQNHFEEAYSG